MSHYYTLFPFFAHLVKSYFMPDLTHRSNVMWNDDHGVTLEIKGLLLFDTWSFVNPTLEQREDQMARHF